MMLCDEARPEITLELDDGLDDEAKARLAGHLIACPDCSNYRSDLHAVAVALDAACLPLREEAAEVVGELPRRPGQETVPVRPPWRAYWAIVGALIALGIIALVAAICS